jgi:hypothetical protein
MIRNHESRDAPAVIRFFLDIAMHRKGPQDVPARQGVFLLALAAYLVAGGLVLWPTAGGLRQLLGQLGADLVLMVAVCAALLALTGRTARLGQTLAALFGTGALLSAAALPFVWLLAATLGDAEAMPETIPPAAALSSIALFGLLLASLLVTGHILRHALDWSYAGGVLAATAYFALSTFVFRSLFPVS